MLATVRNRRGLVTAVESYDALPEGRLHLVNVEYLDADGAPEDSLLWERESGASLLEPSIRAGQHGPERVPARRACRAPTEQR